jgi:hypothetical protein
MIDSIHPVELFKLMERQRADTARQLFSEIEAQWERFGEIRDRDVLLRFAFSDEDFFKKCLLAHRARILHDNVGNVKRAFDILSQSRAALVDLAGTFHSRIEYDLIARDEQDEVLSKATKEIYTYSCAASSLVQAYRHLISGSVELEARYDALKNDLISNVGLFAFFADLRRANNHLHILVAAPHYSITNDFRTGKRTVISGIAFDRDRAMQSDGWNRKSKEFVAGIQNLDVMKLVEEHYTVASEFKRLILTRTGIRNDKQFRDYARIKVARQTMSYQTSLGIILQVAIPKKLNPYEYLERWFTSIELERAYGFQDHTKEQVDYLISLRDPLGLCASHTRTDLYKLFGAATD